MIRACTAPGEPRVSTKQLNSIALVSAPRAEAALEHLLEQNFLLPILRPEKRQLFRGGGVVRCNVVVNCGPQTVKKSQHTFKLLTLLFVGSTFLVYGPLSGPTFFMSTPIQIVYSFYNFLQLSEEVSSRQHWKKGIR